MKIDYAMDKEECEFFFLKEFTYPEILPEESILKKQIDSQNISFYKIIALENNYAVCFRLDNEYMREEIIVLQNIGILKINDYMIRFQNSIVKSDFNPKELFNLIEKLKDKDGNIDWKTYSKIEYILKEKDIVGKDEFKDIIDFVVGESKRETEETIKEAKEKAEKEEEVGKSNLKT